MEHHRPGGKHSSRKLLKAKRGPLLSQSHSINDALRHSKPGQTANVSNEIEKLRASLRSLQKQVTSGGGSQTVVSALADLGRSLEKLDAAGRASAGPQIMSLMTEGLKALSDAQVKAKKAGSDWVL